MAPENLGKKKLEKKIRNRVAEVDLCTIHKATRLIAQRDRSWIRASIISEFVPGSRAYVDDICSVE